MKLNRHFLKTVFIISAATLGSGMFALPYVMASSGWLLIVFYFLFFTIIIASAHFIYFKTLESVEAKERLLGLTKKYFGNIGFWIGFLAIVVGLLLSFTIYLLLGSQFINIIFPFLPHGVCLILLWLIISIPIFLGDKKTMRLEELGVFFVSSTILIVFLSSKPDLVFQSIQLFNSNKLFSPIGVVLFSLAGWTSVESVYLLSIKRKLSLGEKTENIKRMWLAFALGTAFSGLLYFLFSIGFLGSSSSLFTNGNISDLNNWPLWERELVALIGLLSIWTVSMPIGRELRNSFEKDLKWNHTLSRFLIIGIPISIILSGFNNFVIVMELAGGFFIGAQYILILSVGVKALQFSKLQYFFVSLIMALFMFTVVYSFLNF
jgi:amino acid permease